MTKKLPKIYYAYEKMKNIWSSPRYKNHPEKNMMIECFNQAMKEILDTHLNEREECHE